MGKKWFSVAVAVTFLSLVHIAVSIPFIMLHGISAECSDHTNSNFPRLLSNLSGSRSSCVEIGNGKIDSWLMPLTKQVEIVCDKVKQMKELRLGYNIVARSQGNLVARRLIEFCDDGPPVYNYVSLAGPHAGESSVPFCGCDIEWCDIADKLIQKNIYSAFVQDHLAPSGYIKIPNDIPEYMKSSKYLPKLNNEIPNQRNSTYKDRFTRLKNLEQTDKRLQWIRDTREVKLKKRRGAQVWRWKGQEAIPQGPINCQTQTGGRRRDGSEDPSVALFPNV
ncbi:Alpha/Beta hydrolase fold, partial [Arabidopsis thaliana x Arabidopsis arenosa]